MYLRSLLQVVLDSQARVPKVLPLLPGFFDERLQILLVSNDAVDKLLDALFLGLFPIVGHVSDQVPAREPLSLQFLIQVLSDYEVYGWRYLILFQRRQQLVKILTTVFGVAPIIVIFVGIGSAAHEPVDRECNLKSGKRLRILIVR